MKKKQAALCIIDMIICIMFLFVFINKLTANGTLEGMTSNILKEEMAGQERESLKKIAITFDGEVIIGLN